MFLATDFIFTRFVSARPFEVLILVCWSGALLTYLKLRNKDIFGAILLSHYIAAASILIHPNGLLVVVELLFLQIYLDWKYIKIEDYILYVTPYFMAGYLYYLYVLQDPDSWKLQIFANLKMGGVHYSFLDLVKGTVFQEFGQAYGWASYLPPQAKIMIVVLGVYILSYLLCARGLLLWLLLIHTFMFTFVFSHKWTNYTIYFIPLFAISAESAWKKYNLIRYGLIFSVSLSIITSFWRISQYRFKEWTIESEKINVLAKGEKIFAPPELGFALGMENVMADYSLGYFSHKNLNLSVLDKPAYMLGYYKATDYLSYQYAMNILRKSERIYKGIYYDVYRRTL